MKISQVGLNLIKSFEGCVLTAYKPVQAEKYWTIGYGHYGADVKQGSSITAKRAEELLRGDLTRFENAVNSKVKVAINQNQYDALVSFTFNVGEGALQTSTLLEKVNAKDFKGASNEFGRWVKGEGGITLAGLVRRREAERLLFVKPASSNSVKPQENSKYYTSNPRRVKLLKATYLRKVDAVNGVDWDKQSNVIKPLFKKGEEFTITGIKKSSGGTPRLITQSGYLLTANKEYVKQITGSTAVYYTIKQGDTVSVIADKYNVSINQIKTLNNLDNNFRIYAGNKLRVK